ncbi:caspase family protein, partial [Bacteroidota bacterium]
NAGETAKLIITIKNVGPGDAQNVYAEILSSTQGLNFPKKINFKQIKKEGGTESITVYVNGGLDLPSGEASLDIKIIEPDFKVKIQGKRLTFATREFKKPNLIIAKYSILEGTSSSPNNQIDINEIIDLMFAVQNIGEGDAENIKIEVNNSQRGVMFLGCGEGSSISKNLPEFTKISPGKFETVNFRYFLNSDLTDKELRFNIKINEKYNKYGISENKNISINTEQKDEGYIRMVEVTKSEEDKKVIIEDIPDFEIDVRKDIPKLSKSNPDAVAVIIGNKNYRKKDIPSVDFALEDASIMKQYLINTLGYREGNIIYFSNAAQGDMNSVFGTSSNYKGKLYNYVKEGKSDVFIYYSGHGAPDPESKQGYFVPVDCDPSTVSLNGYSLNTFYNNLSKINYKSLTVVIDACFSGSSEKGPLLKNISPVFITIDNQVVIKENTIIFTSSKGDQVSSWYPEKEHSLFTYYFLKGIQGNADSNSDKKLTYNELSDYLLDNVPYMARRLNNREQTPQVIGDDKKVFIEY